MRKSYCYYAQQDYARRSGSYRVDAISPELRRTRLILLGTVAALWICILIARLYSLQLSDFSRWQESALRQHFSEVQLASERGPIYDRSGKLLAVSVPAGSVYVRPRQIKDKAFVSQQIAQVLELDKKQVLEKLTQRKPFVWVKRQVPRVSAEKIAALNMEGVGYFLEARRFYPYKQAASTLIGKVGIDGTGLSGLEGMHEKYLSGKSRTSQITRDALGKKIEIGSGAEEFELPKGQVLKLTLDADIQTIVDEELSAGRDSAKAQAAMALMVDANTGEVLAMSQAPGVNFNSDLIESRAALKNLVVETVFEPGSIMKPLVAAAALESGVINRDDVIFCEDGNLRFGRHMINDVHPNGDLTFHEVVVRSSNIGMTKVGTLLGKERMHAFLDRLGFGKPSGLNLPGESVGILRNPKGWAAVDVATHAFGQGIAVNPLQVVAAMSAIANGGMLPELQIVDNGHGFHSKRVLSERTAGIVQEMMYGVVEEEHGTGKRAAIEGVRVGGKTGTAQRPLENGRGYEAGAYIASFVGFADATALGLSKKLTLMVTIDRPNTTSIYGGTLAGPVFQRIMQRTLHLLTTRNEVNPRFKKGLNPDLTPKLPGQPGYGVTMVGYQPL
ncbi:penicillin-binding protein 2 [Oligoflexia bacterium]|nr:penicillin-binding protein 2 [Oligoflexia bacterium]